MSKHPFPTIEGQPASLRATLFNALYLPAQTGAQAGVVSLQFVRLGHGEDVEFSTSQLVSFFPRGDEHPSLPADLGVADAWVLSGDNTLTAVTF